MAATKKISAAMKSIPAKKESLREALELLKSQSSSSSLASFNLDWSAVDAHFSAVESSIHRRFQKLQSKESSSSSSSSSSEENDTTPRPELESLCVSMDGRGLRSFLTMSRHYDHAAVQSEIRPTLLSAPDSVRLVLDAMADFYSSDLL